MNILVVCSLFPYFSPSPSPSSPSPFSLLFQMSDLSLLTIMHSLDLKMLRHLLREIAETLARAAQLNQGRTVSRRVCEMARECMARAEITRYVMHPRTELMELARMIVRVADAIATDKAAMKAAHAATIEEGEDNSHRPYSTEENDMLEYTLPEDPEDPDTLAAIAANAAANAELTAATDAHIERYAQRDAAAVPIPVLGESGEYEVRVHIAQPEAPANRAVRVRRRLRVDHPNIAANQPAADAAADAAAEEFVAMDLANQAIAAADGRDDGDDGPVILPEEETLAEYVDRRAAELFADAFEDAPDEDE